MVTGRRRSRHIIWLLVLALVGCSSLFAHGIFAKSAGLIGKYDVSYAVINMSGNKYHVSPAVATTSNRSEYFSSMVTRLKPCVAITGTYYDSDYRPLGDIVQNGKVIYRGCQRQGIGFTRKGKIVFLERVGKSRINWTGCYSGIACGPRLLRGGKKEINVQRDGFSKAAAANKARRCAIGATRDGKLVLCVVDERITLNILAGIMLELGAWNAINMDGGSMCAFYKNGRYHVQPAMPMSNILGVYSNN